MDKSAISSKVPLEESRGRPIGQRQTRSDGLGGRPSTTRYFCSSSGARLAEEARIGDAATCGRRSMLRCCAAAQGHVLCHPTAARRVGHCVGGQSQAGSRVRVRVAAAAAAKPRPQNRTELPHGQEPSQLSITNNRPFVAPAQRSCSSLALCPHPRPHHPFPVSPPPSHPIRHFPQSITHVASDFPAQVMPRRHGLPLVGCR